jgi:hypothetical protein
MGYQKIAGVKIEPVGNRFASSTPNWASNTGRAFGGWIYGANLNMGFADQPTTIDLDVALDVQTDGAALQSVGANAGANAGISFDITSGDLKINHAPGNPEQYYKITIGSTEFGPMYLVSYEINGAADSKTLKCNFSDYSAILDKVYVGLFKREGYSQGHAKKLIVNPTMDALCPDCSLSGASNWHITGRISGIIESAAYFINHYNTNGFQLLSAPNNNENYSSYFDRVFNTNSSQYLSSSWNNDQYQPSATSTDALNINGGTLIIGTEEFNENLCSDASNISYNFSELLRALGKLKLKFTKVNSSDLASSWTNDISGKLDKNPNYRQNYNGNLREVLNNWCGDFGLNFHVTGKTICFVDTSVGVNIDALTGAMIPNRQLGQEFNSDKNFGIGNFSQKYNIQESYSQNIVTADVRPRTVRTINKKIQNVCGFIATHPLDWLTHDQTNFNHKTIFRQPFISEKFLNNYDLAYNINYFQINPVPPGQTPANVFYRTTNSALGPYNHYWYTNRALCVIDTCSALIRYNENLRDIYAGALIALNPYLNLNPLLGGNTAYILTSQTSRQNGFNSFGFVPLMTVDGDNLVDFKESIIEKNFSKKAPDGTSQNYILVPDHFSMWIGFYDPEGAQEIKSWEKSIADNIGKYGILTMGNIARFPYLTPDRIDQPSFLAGLTGVSGVQATKINSTTNPSSKNYNDYNSDDFIFRDIFKASGEYLNSSNPNFNLTGLYVAQLENNWGTYEQEVDLKLKRLNNNQGGCDNFKDSSVNNNYYDENSAPATFDLADFTPKFIKLEEGDLDELEEELSNALYNNPAAQSLLGKITLAKKETRIGTSMTTDYSEVRCPKLHVMVIPKVAYPVGYQFQNYPATTTPITNPHLEVAFNFINKRKNKIMLEKLKLFFKQKQDEKRKQFPKNICDISLLDDVCNNGSPRPYPNNPNVKCSEYSNNPTQANSSISDPNCKCESSYTGDFYDYFEFGFASGVIDSDCCRNINVNIRVNPYTNFYNSADYSDNSFGGVSAVPLGEDNPPYNYASTNFDITYPIESTGAAGYNYYSGMLTHDVEIQLRSPEKIEIFGNYWTGITNVAKIQHINNPIEQDIEAQINPYNKSFFQPVYDMLGNKITGVNGYHNLVSSLSDVSNISPAHELNFEIIGDASSADLANFRQTLTPAKGLSSLSFSLGQDGFRTNVSYASVPPKPPKREAILNKINPRINKL